MKAPTLGAFKGNPGGSSFVSRSAIFIRLGVGSDAVEMPSPEKAKAEPPLDSCTHGLVLVTTTEPREVWSNPEHYDNAEGLEHVAAESFGSGIPVRRIGATRRRVRRARPRGGARSSRRARRAGNDTVGEEGQLGAPR